VAVDVERILGQIAQVLQHNQEKRCALDGGQIEFANIARILAIEFKTHFAACPSTSVVKRH